MDNKMADEARLELRSGSLGVLLVAFNVVFHSSYFRLSFYGQLLEQLQCCLTARPYCLHSVFICYCWLWANIWWWWWWKCQQNVAWAVSSNFIWCYKYCIIIIIFIIDFVVRHTT